MKAHLSWKLAFLIVMLPWSLPADGWTPFQLSLWNPIQVFSEDSDVYGLRLNLLYGKNNDVHGLDLGIANRATNEVRGVQVGAFCGAGKSMTGIQAAGLVNYAESMTGFQIAGLGNLNSTTPGVVQQKGPMLGLQIAGLGNKMDGDVIGAQLTPFIVNSVAGDMTGFQLAMINNCEGRMIGFQCGSGLVGVNHANETNGLQGGIGIWGAFNSDAHVRGVQVAVGGLAAINSLSDSPVLFNKRFNKGVDVTTMRGVQIAAGLIAWNRVHQIYGVQICPWYNEAVEMRGFQLGLVNYCRDMAGVQIGLVNIIAESPLSFFPVINAYF